MPNKSRVESHTRKPSQASRILETDRSRNSPSVLAPSRPTPGACRPSVSRGPVGGREGGLLPGHLGVKGASWQGLHRNGWNGGGSAPGDNTHLCSCLLAPQHARMLACSILLLGLLPPTPASSTPVLSHPKYQSATVPPKGVWLYTFCLCLRPARGYPSTFNNPGCLLT